MLKERESDIPATPRSDDRESTLAERLLGRPLSTVLSAVVVLQIATWLPHYLTWPYWADHDVFATAARAWDEGRLPYRDTLGNNFPGTVYLFALLGRLAGWDRRWPLFAFDAGLLLAFLGLMIVWSRQRFGRILPGLVGSLIYVSYYLGLDYSHAAQRDWHGPAFACGAILIAQVGLGRWGLVISALLAVVAVTFRPQTVLLLPAVGLAALHGSTKRTRLGGHLQLLVAWLSVFTAGLALAFAPLAGVLDDFVRGLGLTAYGGAYNQVTPLGFVKAWLTQAAPWRWWAVSGGVVLLGWPFATKRTQTALPWLLAMLGGSLYKPLSPVAHSYLDIPLVLVGSVLTACLVGVVLGIECMPSRMRLALVLLTLGLGTTTLRPEFCRLGPSLHALSCWVGNRTNGDEPPGYRKGSVPTSAYYDWNDYRSTLDYLRRSLTERTRIANVLKGDPAVTSMVNRPSVFPAESVAWLRMVRREDEGRFAEALERTPDSVVVWVPGEVGPDPKFTLERLTPVIRRLYRPEATFGVIEVWRRASP